MMQVINFSQREDDWLKWRRKGITATDAVVLLGLSPYKTSWRLWAEKSGYCREVDLSMNPLVRRGVMLEDTARKTFEAKHDDLLLPVCAESTKNSVFRASFDGISNSGTPVELKCPSEKTWNEVVLEKSSSQAYRLYYPQVQEQMYVSEASHAWLVFYHEGETYDFRIERDPAMIKDIIEAGKAMWKAVQERKEPPKDPARDVYIPKGDDLMRWMTQAHSYRFYEAEIQDLKARLEQLKDQQKPHLDEMKALMGEYRQADYAGVMVTRYEASGNIDYKKLLSEEGASLTDATLEKYRKPCSERTRVTVTEDTAPRDVIDQETLEPLEKMSELIEPVYF